MIDLTKPVQTRDGLKVRVLCTNMKGRDTVAGVITDHDGTDMVDAWQADGHYNIGPEEARTDLINVPEKRVVWVNMYEDSEHFGHNTLEEAIEGGENGYGKQGCDARVRVEYEVGQFDEEPES